MDTPPSIPSIKDFKTDEIMQILNTVEDPEVGVGIVDMGLIYAVKTEGEVVTVDMTLTSMGCPIGPMLIQNVQEALKPLAGVERVDVNIVWDPPWSVEKMNPDIRAMLM